MFLCLFQHRSIWWHNWDATGWEWIIYHSYKYGVTIIIPHGAVQQQCTLRLGSCLVLPYFKSNDSFIPVSPFVCIDIDCVLLKPAELYIPHYVDIRSDKHKKKIFVLSTEDNTSEKEDTFIFIIQLTQKLVLASLQH